MQISYTALHSLMECEYSYFLRYIDRVSIMESSASVYGTAVHRTMITTLLGMIGQKYLGVNGSL